MQLILMRHAHSFERSVHSDHARPLSPEGRAAAAQMGARLASLVGGPLFAYVSDAARCQETWQQLSPALEGAQLQVLPALYLADAERLHRQVELACAQQPQAGAILLLAHNPGISDLYTQYTQRFTYLEPADAVILQQGDPQRGRWRLERELRAPLGEKFHP